LNPLYDAARLGGRFGLGNHSVADANRLVNRTGKISCVFRGIESRYGRVTDKSKAQGQCLTN